VSVAVRVAWVGRLERRYPGRAQRALGHRRSDLKPTGSASAARAMYPEEEGERVAGRAARRPLAAIRVAAAESAVVPLPSPRSRPLIVGTRQVAPDWLLPQQDPRRLRARLVRMLEVRMSMVLPDLIVGSMAHRREALMVRRGYPGHQASRVVPAQLAPRASAVRRRAGYRGRGLARKVSPSLRMAPLL
jgi:hypothetical protein